jgi:hypothetical protein
VTKATAPGQPDIHELLHAINRDLRGANALARACLAGLATVSDEARGAIDAALADEVPAADDRRDGWIPEAALALAWHQMNMSSPAHDRLCEAMERALVSKAAEIEDEAAPRQRRA